MEKKQVNIDKYTEYQCKSCLGWFLLKYFNIKEQKCKKCLSRAIDI